MSRQTTRKPRTDTVTVRIDPDTLRAAELVAQATCRSVSGLMHFALQQYIAKQYPAALQPGARVTAKIEADPE